MRIAADENMHKAALSNQTGLSGWYLPRGREVFWPLTLNHTLIYAVMKDHHKKGSELISLEMKERETASVRDRGEGRRTLVDISKGWWYQRLDACDLLLALCVNMQSWSRHAICQCWLESNIWMQFECFLQGTGLGEERGRRVYWVQVGW